MDQSVNHAFRLVILTLEDMQKRLANLEKKAAFFQEFIEQHGNEFSTGSDVFSESDDKTSGSAEEDT